MVTSFLEITRKKHNTPVELGCAVGEADDTTIKKIYCWKICYSNERNKMMYYIG